MTDSKKTLTEVTPELQRQAERVKKERQKNYLKNQSDERIENSVTLFSKYFSLTLMVFGLLFMIVSMGVALNLINKVDSEVPPSTILELMDSEELAADIQKLSPELRLSLELELELIRLRHLRSASSIQTRTWLRYSSMTLGFICVVVGCAFILARIRSPRIDASAEGSMFKGSISTASPGLALVAFGIVLCIIPNVAKQPVTTTDGAVYFKPVTYFKQSTSSSESKNLMGDWTLILPKK